MKPVIRLLTVDAAGTLIRPWPSVGTVYAQTAREHGIIAEDKEIDRRFYKVFGNIQKNQSITLGEEKDFWKHQTLVHQILSGTYNRSAYFPPLYFGQSIRACLLTSSLGIHLASADDLNIRLIF